MEKVSVIIPVYNVERYLKQCVDSVLNQTYHNLEIILVNDGSPDDCGDICNKYLQLDNRVKVIHKSNAGLGFARNSGLEIATGKYAVFIDSDDYISKNMIEVLMLNLEKTKADTVICGFIRVTDNGDIKYTELCKNNVYEGLEVKDRYLKKILGSKPKNHDAIRMSVWGALFSMDIIRKYNICFPSEREFISEDLLFDFYYYQFAQKVCLLSENMYYYRINSQSLTNSYRTNKFEMIKKMYLVMEKKVEELYGVGDDALTRLQSQFLINLRTCLEQEAKSSNIDKVTRIKQMCDDETVCRVIKEYPLKWLNVKQLIFVQLIKYRMTYVLMRLI